MLGFNECIVLDRPTLFNAIENLFHMKIIAGFNSKRYAQVYSMIANTSSLRKNICVKYNIIKY